MLILMTYVEMNEDVEYFSCQDDDNYIISDLHMKMLYLKDTAVKNFITKD